jgi:hypothetical protein
LAANYSQTIAFALERLAGAGSAFAADADQTVEDSRQVLEATSSADAKAALKNDLITKKQLSGIASAAKQAVETMKKARAAQDRNFAQFEKRLRQLADRTGGTQ